MRFVVSGQSMEPTFTSGQALLASKIPYLFGSPKPNDIVVVKDPRNGRLLVKRITKKNDKQFFVIGDNEKESTDSRTFGAVTKKEIVGKIIYKVSSKLQVFSFAL